jgi:hypothetical protein
VAQGFSLPGIQFPHPTEINFVLTAAQAVWDGLVADGYSFSRRGAPRDCGVERRTRDKPPLIANALACFCHRAILAHASKLGAEREVIGRPSVVPPPAARRPPGSGPA